MNKNIAEIKRVAESELSRSRFIRLATKRTQLVLDRIRILSHCSNRNFYEFNDRDAKRIFDTIQEQLDLARSKFSAKKKIKFKLE